MYKDIGPKDHYMYCTVVLPLFSLYNNNKPFPQCSNDGGIAGNDDGDDFGYLYIDLTM